MKEVIAGIDLGTTNSAIAFLKEGVPEIVLIDGQPTMPSCIGIDPNGKLLVGHPARNMLIASPESTVLSIKRKMGQDTRVALGQKDFSPVEISSFILRRLKEEAEKFLDHPVQKAVITVPAFFDEKQRKATQDAGALAGLEVVRIINEPTAAVLAYDAGHSGDERILVYDLGGGTFDVSVVVVEAGVVEVKASHGDTQLGGDDFDQLLIQHVVEEFHQRHHVFLNENPRTSRRLKLILERVKCQLSDEPFARIREEYIHQDIHLETEIQRDEYEEMILPYLQKTLDCIHHALQDARLLPGDISKVMLVGGATRTPLVHQLIEEKLGIAPRWEINPDLIVALGASIAAAGMAGEKTKSILVDITAHSFGVEAVASSYQGERMIYTPIIHRNTPLPVSKSEIYTTHFDNQTEVHVVVYEGEDPVPENNTLIGEFHVEGLRKANQGNPIVLNFNLDLNGMLKVTATEKETGLQKSVTLDTRGGRSAQEFEESRKNIQSMVGQGAEDSTDDQTLLSTAKDLRKRAEALLQKGVSEEDANEIRDLLKQSAEVVKTPERQKLNGLNERLSDIIFYLED
jgi:molecular chaperone DnaK